MTKLRSANLLGALAVAIADRVESVLKSHPNQNDSAAAALNLIALYEGCSIAALAKGLKLSHPATVRMVAKLEASGLVAARAGPDKRSSALFLSDQGRAQAADLIAARSQALAEMVDVLSAEQCAQLDAIAATLLRSFTTSPAEGGYICRLCDEPSCPEDRCPVHVRALELTPS